jgi:hypothetical protein
MLVTLAHGSWILTFKPVMPSFVHLIRGRGLEHPVWPVLCVDVSFRTALTHGSLMMMLIDHEYKVERNTHSTQVWVYTLPLEPGLIKTRQ